MCEDRPMQGVSPTRPSILFRIPPVDVAQATLPSLSTATAPTVPIFPLHSKTQRNSRVMFELVDFILKNTEGITTTSVITKLVAKLYIQGFRNIPTKKYLWVSAPYQLLISSEKYAACSIVERAAVVSWNSQQLEWIPMMTQRHSKKKQQKNLSKHP